QPWRLRSCCQASWTLLEISSMSVSGMFRGRGFSGILAFSFLSLRSDIFIVGLLKKIWMQAYDISTDSAAPKSADYFLTVMAYCTISAVCLSGSAREFPKTLGTRGIKNMVYSNIVEYSNNLQ